LAEVLATVPQTTHPDLLVGYNTADDAGVFRISENLALVQTVDFFPPIVDDPYFFGQIAAANALSDIFAMGGRPITALNIVAFPKGTLPAEILGDILRGGKEKVEEAGAIVVGGHSIKDTELKYGIAATGLIDPSRIILNSGAKPGDVLFLTKRLGTGLITTGIKRNKASAELTDVVIKQMAQLNRAACELMLQYDVHAATDITGYGLLGHAYEMATASNATIRLFADKLPLLPEALEMAEAGMIPGGANDNREFLEGKALVDDAVDRRINIVAFDPQTSGGLFIAIPESQATEFASELKKHGLPHESIGKVEPFSDIWVTLA
jgi:selenide,water dikinase